MIWFKNYQRYLYVNILKGEYNMKNCIIYTRVSTTEQAQNGYSLKKQLEDCKEFAKRQGYNILVTFEERGESAKTTDRSELQALMKYCSVNKSSIDALVLWKIDRLSRNMEDYYFLNNFFKKLNIEILSATETNDNSAMGKLSRNILGAFAQFENDQKSERVTAGMKQAFIEGKWLWKAPYGYKLINGNMYHDDEKAPVVKRIYELFSTGIYTQSQIRTILNRENISVSSSQMFCILKNAVYCGRMYCPSLSDNMVKGDFEPIISEELYDKVQILRNGTKPIVTSYLRNNAEFPLRQFIICPFCGEPLTASKSTGSKNKKYAYYHCYNKDCKTQVRIPKDKLERMFVDYLSELKPSEDYMQLFKQNVKTAYQNAVKTKKDILVNLKHDLKAVKEKQDKLVNMYIEGKLREADYKLKSEQFEQEEKHIKICLSDVEKPENDFEKCFDFVCNALENIDKLWLDSDLDTKQRLQKIVFPQGLVYENNGFRNGSNSWFYSKKGGLLPPDFNMVPPSEFESLSTP